ncbi:MAG TPA: hypothetical protein VFZ73_10960 [Gemmatimonadaceae bacterium]
MPRTLQLLALTLICASSVVSGQGTMPPATGTPGVAGEVRTVSGRVLSGSSDSLRPVPGQYVVLHRISADSSGPVDSMRTTASGTYRFRYRLAGPRSMYIVSARYAGVAYFTTPLREANVGSPDADISVYDTTSAAFPLTVRARHVVVSPGESGTRRVVDVFEVANDSNLTLVAGAAGATWRVALPPGASDPGSSGGDLPPDAFRFAEGVAELLVPFPPGSRQVVLTYAIPARTATIPIADPTANLEVLLEGAEGRVSGAGLTAEEPVSLEGRTFKRYTAAPAAAGAAVVVAGGSSGSATRVALLAVAAVAVALGIVVGRRGGTSPAVAAVTPATTGPDAIARAITALDNVYADASRREGAAGAHYRDRRQALMRRLVEAQAVEDGAAPR